MVWQDSSYQPQLLAFVKSDYSDLFVWCTLRVWFSPVHVWLFSGETVPVISLSGITPEVCGCLSRSLGQELVSLTLSSYQRQAESGGRPRGLGFLFPSLPFPRYRFFARYFKKYLFRGSLLRSCVLLKFSPSKSPGMCLWCLSCVLSLICKDKANAEVSYLPFFSSVSECSVSPACFNLLTSRGSNWPGRPVTFCDDVVLGLGLVLEPMINPSPVQTCSYPGAMFCPWKHIVPTDHHVQWQEKGTFRFRATAECSDKADYYLVNQFRNLIKCTINF